MAQAARNTKIDRCCDFPYKVSGWNSLTPLDGFYGFVLPPAVGVNSKLAK
jgi:hypothetical protein